LGEINHEAREEAYHLGITQFEMSAGLNDSPKFIQALGQLVQNALGEQVSSRIPIQGTERQLAARQYATAAGLD